MQIINRVLEFGSEAQRLSVELRFEVLRKPLGLNFDPSDLAREGEDYHLASFIDSKIVGILLLKPVSKETVKMRQVAVKTDSQNKGIGKSLVRFAEEFAQKKGYTTMQLNARKTALPFYLALEYQTLGDEFHEVGIPHLKMEKNLTHG